jgi:hypothetical protein
MNTGDPTVSDFELTRHPPDSNPTAWNYGLQNINDYFAAEASWWTDVNEHGELKASHPQPQSNGQTGSGSGMDIGGGSDSVLQQQQQQHINHSIDTETNENGELVASHPQSQFNGQAGSGGGMDTGGGSGSVLQQQHIDHSIDFLPTFPSTEVLTAVVSTNQQSSPTALPDPVLISPSVIVSDTELPAAEKAEISKLSSSLVQSDFGGEHDSDVAMKDSSPPPFVPFEPFVRATTPLVVGREGAQTLPYGTDGTAARTPHSTQQHLPQVPMVPSNAPAQTLSTTPNMAATATIYGSSPYYRGRHTQSTDGAESLRRDMEQPNILPASTAAIPFPGLKTQETTSLAQETSEDDESAFTSAKITKKRKSTRKPQMTTETATASVQETADDDEETVTLAKMGSKRTRKAKSATETTTSLAEEAAEASDLSNITLAVPKRRNAARKSGPTAASSAQESAKVEESISAPTKVTKTRKPKAPVETQMFAVTTTSDNGTTTEKLAKGSELGFTSPAPKAVARSHKRKAQAIDPVHQGVAARSHKRKVQAIDPVQQGIALANKRGKPHKNYCSDREVRMLTGVEVKEDKEEGNKRKTRSSLKAGGEEEVGPDAGRAVRQRRQAKK